jgi:chromosome segregation ATPase
MYPARKGVTKMSEDATQNLPQASFEERVFTSLSAIQAEQSAMRTELSTIRNDVAVLGERLTSLEEKVDRRLQETRPLWEAVQAQIRKLDTKFDIVIRELYEIRYDHVILGKRVDELEKASLQ